MRLASVSSTILPKFDQTLYCSTILLWMNRNRFELWQRRHYPPSTISSRHRSTRSMFSSTSPLSMAFLQAARYRNLEQTQLALDWNQKENHIGEELIDINNQTAPYDKRNRVEDSLKNSAQDEFVFFITSGHIEVDVLDKPVDNNVVFENCYVCCRLCKGITSVMQVGWQSNAFFQFLPNSFRWDWRSCY